MPSRRPHTPKPVPSPAAPARHTPAGLPPIGKPWHIVLRSPKHTHRLGRCLGTLLQGGEVLALFGELGAGKTSLVKGIADGLLAEPTDVSSPTFTLIHEYRGRLPLVHSDLYRLNASSCSLPTASVPICRNADSMLRQSSSARWRRVGLPLTLPAAIITVQYHKSIHSILLWYREPRPLRPGSGRAKNGFATPEILHRGG